MDIQERLKECLIEIKTEYEKLVPNQLTARFVDAVHTYDELTREFESEQQAKELKKVVELVGKEKFLSALYMYSLFTFRSHEPAWMEGMLETIESVPVWDADVLYFLYWQIVERYMLWPESESEKGLIAHWKLFQRLCHQCAAEVTNTRWIPLEDRNSELVVVVLTQFLEPTGHGPTKTALDRCQSLIEKMNKKVLIINTAEASVNTTKLPWAGLCELNYLESLSALEYIEWKGCKIPFFQCDNNMPNMDVYRMLIDYILQMKPQFIIEIGTGSVFAHLASKCVPVLSVVTGFSRLAISETPYQVSALKMTDKERRILHAVGKTPEHVIPTVFTFGIKNQQKHLTRGDLGLPEDKFLLAVVGTRLHLEIDDSFMRLVSMLDDQKFAVVLVGKFDNYESFIEKYPQHEKKMFYIGEQDDVLAVYDVCDLFVNPIRLGGGTSAVEALSKQLPVVSTSYGDVGVTVGEDFLVKDYEDMADTIVRYYEDAAFYEEQQKNAASRAAILLDTDSEFEKTLREFGKRMGEEYIL